MTRHPHYPPPTRRERADMEAFGLGIHCLREEHQICGGTFVRDLKSEHWFRCACFCHTQKYKAKLWTPGDGLN
jgi:hypothetical protein